MRVVLSRYLFAALLLTGAAPVVADLDASALYARHCAQCHGADRLGLMGPALLPENLTRVKKKAAAKKADETDDTPKKAPAKKKAAPKKKAE